MTGSGTESSGLSSAPTNPRVLALIADSYGQPNTVDWYRIVSPYQALQRRGYPYFYLPYDQARQLAIAGKLHPEQFDVVVMCRASVGLVDNRLIEFMQIVHESGRKLIYETDDDYTNEYRRATSGDAITVAQTCDAITTTTPHLGKVLGQHNSNIYVLPNAISLEAWDGVELEPRDPENVTVALAGTGTHLEDYRLVKDTLFRLAEEFSNVRFLLMGYKPYFLEGLPRTEYVAFLPYPEYIRLLGRVDIGLCPLVPDDAFNKAKSAVKALEYMAAGAAVVAQNMKVYRRVVNNRHNGLLASEDWYEQIVSLIVDRTMRQHIAKTGQRWAKKHRNIRRLAPKWVRAYEEVYRL